MLLRMDNARRDGNLGGDMCSRYPASAVERQAGTDTEETEAKASVTHPGQQSLDSQEMEGAGGTRPRASRGSTECPVNFSFLELLGNTHVLP